MSAPSTPSGWLCPVCEAVNAPFVLECSCSRQQRTAKPVGNPTLNEAPLTKADVARMIDNRVHRGAPRMK